MPCLQGLQKIPPVKYKHLRKLVIAMQILLGSSITDEQLEHADTLLQSFVVDLEKIYGPIHMTLNVQ